MPSSPSSRAPVALRPSQAPVLAYAGGELAVSAVPGAGKSFVLAHLVARLIGELGAAPEHVLVLTYMRGAAEGFAARAKALLAEQGLPHEGLKVTTLHAFCHGLLRRYGGWAGDEAALVTEAARRERLGAALDVLLDEGAHRSRYEAVHGLAGDPRPRTVETASRAIACARAFGLDAAGLARAIAPLPCPELGDLAAAYEREMASRGALDFDDLALRALALLRENPAALADARARDRWVLEDEAQDATPAQTELLALLAGPEGNWVRVGDANQAITGTFTFAHPGQFRGFCERLAPGGRHVRMDESARSGAPLLALANGLVAFSAAHPDPVVARAFAPAAARPAAGGANPPASACRTHFFAYETRDHERLGLLEQVRAYMAHHPVDEPAALCYTNASARALIELAGLAGLPLADDDAASAPGRLRVLTLHRAKGREFDAVWLSELGATGSRGGPVSAFPWELDAVRLADPSAALVLQAIARHARGLQFDEAAMLLDARREAVAERLRLLYVGLTRARRCLTLSCVAGARSPAPPLHVQHLARMCL